MDWKNYFTTAMAKEIEDKLLALPKAVDPNFQRFLTKNLCSSQLHVYLVCTHACMHVSNIM